MTNLNTPITILLALIVSAAPPRILGAMGSTSGEEEGNRSLSNVGYVSMYYGAANYHRWLHTQYPLLNISDRTSFDYHLLTYATLERNLSNEIVLMLAHELRSLCFDLNPQCKCTHGHTQHTFITPHSPHSHPSCGRQVVRIRYAHMMLLYIIE